MNYFLVTYGLIQTQDTRRKVVHMSPPCKVHRRAQKPFRISSEPTLIKGELTFAIHKRLCFINGATHQ